MPAASEVGVITYYALASGFLTGKYRSRGGPRQERARRAACKKYLNARGMRILAGARRGRRRSRRDPGAGRARLADRAPGITAPIASATKPEQVDTLVAAATLSLSQDQVARLDEASA